MDESFVVATSHLKRGTDQSNVTYVK